MKIILCGDLFCGGDLLNEVPAVELIKIPDWSDVDFRIANLENPMSDRDEIIDKCTIHSPTRSVEYLKNLKIDGVTLANNHIQDKGDKGIKDTIDVLEHHSIKHCGAGQNIYQARTPMLLEKDGEKVAVFAYCDFDRPYLRQVQVATETRPGVSPLRYDVIIEDLDDLDDNINEAILFLHWGREHTWFPPRSDLNLAKKILEHPKVCLVVGSHPHLPQGFIEHQGKKAFMSLGNFLFPNFFLDNPTQIKYPSQNCNYDIIHGYHPVSRLTHKRWLKWSRRSILIILDTTANKHNLVFSEQDYLRPIVRKILPLRRVYITTYIYNNINNTIYDIISGYSYKYVKFGQHTKYYLYYIKQNGVKAAVIKFANKYLNYIFRIGLL